MIICSKNVFGTAIVGLPDPGGIPMQSGTPKCHSLNASLKNQFFGKIYKMLEQKFLIQKHAYL